MKSSPKQTPAKHLSLPPREWDLSPKALRRVRFDDESIAGHADAEWGFELRNFHILVKAIKPSPEQKQDFRQQFVTRHRSVWMEFSKAT